MTDKPGGEPAIPATRMVIHGGFPKTATTSLQHEVFGRLPGIANLGRPDPAYEDARGGLRPAVLRDGDDVFAASLGDLRAAVRDWAAGAPAGATLVLSDEHIATGHHTSPYAAQPPGTILARLVRLFPEAGILMVLRAQPDVLMAEYVNQLRMGHTQRGPDAWLEGEARKPDGGALAAYDYGRRLAEMRDSFGPSRVHLLLYEDMRRDPSGFAGQLAAILRLDADAVQAALARPRANATTHAEMAYLRLRRYVPGAVRRAPVLRGLRRWVGLDAIRRLGHGTAGRGWARGASGTFGPTACAIIDAYYAESNDTLSLWFQRDLAVLGYPSRAHRSPPETGIVGNVQAEERL
jgi:hypothetical protein